LYGTLIFLFSRVALNDNMHFQILKLEGPPIVTNNGLVFGETTFYIASSQKMLLRPPRFLPGRSTCHGIVGSEMHSRPFTGCMAVTSPVSGEMSADRPPSPR